MQSLVCLGFRLQGYDFNCLKLKLKFFILLLRFYILKYCGKDRYSNHTFTGPSKGFVFTGLIYDNSTDIEGRRIVHWFFHSILIPTLCI